MRRDGIELLCPVVNMARSDAKKISESPMIGEAISLAPRSSFHAFDQASCPSPRSPRWWAPET